MNIVSVSPQNEQKGVFLTQDIIVQFDSLVDEESINTGTFVVSGPESVVMSGPDLTLWSDRNRNQDIFESPGFKGIISGTISFDTISDGDTETSRVTFHPDRMLAPDTKYTIYLYGYDTGNESRYIQTVSVGAVTSIIKTGTGNLSTTGSYYGDKNKTLIVEIISEGERGEAFFQYWFSDNETISDEILVRRTIQLPNVGISLEFSNGKYEIGDKWSIPLYEAEPLDGIYSWYFTTGSEKLVSPPTEDSEIAPELEELLTGDISINSDLSTFPNGSYNVSTSIREIEIIINTALNTDTVNTDTVKMIGQELTYPYTETTIPIAVDAELMGTNVNGPMNKTRVRIRL